ncbi:hypothetical protein O181_009598 [Austropuccinia psidii MF-1]|uniref:Uncharacterized protein n=1 Tax=Austropuccinia psidii MF-1 TaxID=1389203 RepID=A0A9Q3GJK9_9BASI|nr:hypothetical protein [Austropuccinia psidii MF-1]
MDYVEGGESLTEGSQVVINWSSRQNFRKKTKSKCHQKEQQKTEAAKNSQDQGDFIINVEVNHNDNEPLHTETPIASPQNIQGFQEKEKIKHDTMGQEGMTDIMPEVSTSANV